MEYIIPHGYLYLPEASESDIHSFNNIKKLVRQIVSFERLDYTETAFAPFKDLNTYSRAYNYVVAISAMINRASTYPAIGVYINSPEMPTNPSYYTVEDMADADSEFNKLARDMGFYQRVLSTGVMMRYFNQLLVSKTNNINTAYSQLTMTELAQICSFCTSGGPTSITIPLKGYLESSVKQNA